MTEQAFDNFFNSILHGIEVLFETERARIELYNSGGYQSAIPADAVISVAEQIEEVKRLNQPVSGGYDSSSFDRQADAFIRAALLRPTIKSAPHKIHVIDED
jgi:hypothetical protein